MKLKNIILFLDIDGVLNIYGSSSSTWFKTGEHLDTLLVDNFNNFLDKYENIKIVISSSWRDDMDDLELQLKKHNFKHFSRIIACTTFKYNYRGEQIMDYIVNNDIEKYIVIDDNMDDICGKLYNSINSKYCLKTDSYQGLNEDKIKELEIMLSKII